MDLFQELARLTAATEDNPLVLGNVEFWIDPVGPWAGQLAFYPTTSQWDALAIGVSVAKLSNFRPEVRDIVSRYAN